MHRQVAVRPNARASPSASQSHGRRRWAEILIAVGDALKLAGDCEGVKHFVDEVFSLVREPSKKTV